MNRIAGRTRSITLIAVMAALVFAVTWLVRIPVPSLSGAYFNLGDTVIYLCAMLAGGPYAALAAAVGSGFADLAAGAPVYILPTVFIKGLMGFMAGKLSFQSGMPRFLLACVLGGAVMTAGYGLFESVAFGGAYAIGSVPYNLLQWGTSTAVSAALYPAVKKVRHFIPKNI
jgi:uncharacterized membrane protein